MCGLSIFIEAPWGLQTVVEEKVKHYSLQLNVIRGIPELVNSSVLSLICLLVMKNLLVKQGLAVPFDGLDWFVD